jgi:uncharacterized protein (TIGR02996 family)
MPMRRALESALVENPDDLATHRAHADYLSDQGDPRGEFISLQLQREECASQSDSLALQAREEQLWQQHGRDWLGSLAPFLLDQGEYISYEWTFRRGWLDTLDVMYLEPPFAEALAQAPEARLLSGLRIYNASAPTPLAERPFWDMDPEEPEAEDPDHPANDCIEPLVPSEHLRNLRKLHIGGTEFLAEHPEDLEDKDPRTFLSVSGVGVAGWVAHLPRLQELRLLVVGLDTERLFGLRNLEQLRILQVYDASRYPLAEFAANPAVARLTHLLLQPRKLFPGEDAHIQLNDVRALVRSPHLPSLTHLTIRLSDMGDAGVEVLLASGILRQLEVLDLRYGQISDAGASRLAACPDVARLKQLNLSNNRLSERGETFLRSAGVNLLADEQGYGSDLFETDLE